MIMAKSKEEQIFIGIDDQVIELTGADKDAFLAQRASNQAEAQTLKAEAETRKQVRISALQKLGLTEEEINAIF
jgi:Holliday junction resolvasome RuvABC DNA-binding subunit